MRWKQLNKRPVLFAAMHPNIKRVEQELKDIYRQIQFIGAIAHTMPQTVVESEFAKYGARLDVLGARIRRIRRRNRRLKKLHARRRRTRRH